MQVFPVKAEASGRLLEGHVTVKYFLIEQAMLGLVKGEKSPLQGDILVYRPAGKAVPENCHKFDEKVVRIGFPDIGHG